MSAPESASPSLEPDLRFGVERLDGFFSRATEAVLDDPLLPIALEAAITGLERGVIRAALPVADGGGWRAVPWVKTAILAGFRSTPIVEMPGGAAPALDRAAFPVRRFEAGDGIRLVPGGSAVRRGAHLAAGVVVMPPSYVNVGAWVGEGTMIDSHVLVGSCAQIGAHVHLSAGVQIGGVLEPPGALPVVVESGAFVGAQSGVFEGVLVGRRAVLAPGVHLTASTLIYDLVEETIRRGQVPEGAVVVPGARTPRGAFAEEHGLSLFAPIIVKYRDASTDAATALEEALR
ncbi:MAG TPA: 2,3,4,5-tetrahydropyridine-2,6-dicarboxylate N-succinyltransferase [Thermoanaerobaculia bacterium]|nr:2,3,4,5-tetrahydropyridine-2,6-dicarboxylate N-succinyltransferase [Thermoanaerobaculia bacterium]